MAKDDVMQTMVHRLGLVHDCWEESVYTALPHPLAPPLARRSDKKTGRTKCLKHFAAVWHGWDIQVCDQSLPLLNRAQTGVAVAGGGG